MPLNENQRKAVEYLDGPLLVLAGPGTGKTQLLSEKVAYILKHTDTNPALKNRNWAGRFKGEYRHLPCVWL